MPPDLPRTAPPDSPDTGASTSVFAHEADSAAPPAGRRPPRPLLPAQRIRWGLLAIAVGAVVAALVTMLISGFRSSHGLEAHDPGSTEPTGRAHSAFGSARPGDCLTWSSPKALDLTKVNCADKHLFEVTAEIDLSKYPGKEFGPGSRFPDMLRFSELRDEHCAPAAAAYLGGKLDPRGRFVVGIINPGEPGWAHGDRTIRCGLQVVSATGSASQQAVGRVRDSDQSRTFEVGQCVGIAQSLPTNEPVDCAKPHAYEVMSVEDLGSHFTGGPPAKDEQDKFMQDACGKVINDYLGGQDALLAKTLTAFWDSIDARSWLVGSRRLNCFVGKGSQDGFSTITGPAKADILIDGQAPVPPPTSGRSTPAPLPGAAPPR
ncbi:septum formation family protein [Nocardia aurantia]|uniref:Putative membrane protein n=1 Tax=Nocardia aurantia TaxID=2585199 RepID=A0A7K0DMF6_9NOCA|nr:septum formation family protein [Nocardia aurantia]MQY26936.1 putative membrane protein [Nocardia aurantia]